MEKQQRAPRHSYTSEEIEFLKKIVKGRSYKEISALFNERFGLELTSNQIRGMTTRLGLHTGRVGLHNGIKTRYIPPKNYHPPYLIDYEFKPGGRPWNFQPIGTERLKTNGYMIVKIANPKVWKYKHNIIWEKAHGPIPKDCKILFADGNKLNFSLNNLLLVSNAELGMMNKLHIISSDPELTKTGLQLAKLRLLVGKHERELKEKGVTA